MDFSTLAFYVTTLVAYFIIYNIFAWGLNIQFGYAGIPNFTYITFVAMGAYIAGVTALGPPGTFADIHYILGLGWPFPVTLLAGGVAAAALGLALGLLALPRLRDYYLAIVTFSFGFVAFDFVSSVPALFNGFAGISGVPAPLADTVQLDPNSYQYFFIGMSGLIMVLLWIAANRIYDSALGRTMRAIREDSDVAEALGKNTFAVRLVAMGVGCFYAGIGGGLLIEYISAFNPSGWGTPETFIIFAAVLIGGRANNWGTFLGCLLVPIALIEATRFLPGASDHPELIPGLRLMLIGALMILALWFRPAGLLPERRHLYEIPIGPPANQIRNIA